MESYNYTQMGVVDRAEIEDRIALEHGELVPVTEDYLVTEAVQVAPAYTETLENGESIQHSAQVEQRRVKKTNTYEYYIGKMGAGELGGIMSILGAIFVNGATAKMEEARRDNLVFLEYLDEYHIELLLSIIMREKVERIHHCFDIEWVVPVVATFFKYNNFFRLAEMLVGTVRKMGLTEATARNIALGESAS